MVTEREIIHRLAARMDSIGWNQMRLAREAKLEHSLLSRMFKRKSGKLGTVLHLSHVLGMSARDLLSDDAMTAPAPAHTIDDCLRCVSDAVHGSRATAREKGSDPLAGLPPLKRRVIKRFLSMDDAELEFFDPLSAAEGKLEPKKKARKA